ncbi:glycosyltransferase [Chitinibacter tainanensis]|uniref:glycosyltransferase family 2 protein n=1 Tax=Chitinibacter tainanensis TaxID=230667 RepID=UPI002354D1BB|nr:glycosyltransferase [Chitinibacter tainanensis]
MKLSIVVPVYNVANYIVECVNSLLHEKPRDAEIILVNDGSPDQSESVIFTHYAQQLHSGDLVYIKQQNQGVSAARNVGIAAAKGQYITFVDGDDYILPGYYAAIYPVMNEAAPDIIEFGWKTFKQGDVVAEQPEQYVHSHFGPIPIEFVRNEIFAASIWYPVIRIYRRELLPQPCFPVGVRFCEDLMVLHHVYNAAKRIFQVRQAFYAYRINANGATLNIQPVYREALIQFYQSILGQKEHHYDLLKISLFYMIFRCSVALKMPVDLPADVNRDLWRLRSHFYRYLAVGQRRIRILLMPKLSAYLQK